MFLRAILFLWCVLTTHQLLVTRENVSSASVQDHVVGTASSLTDEVWNTVWHQSAKTCSWDGGLMCVAACLACMAVISVYTWATSENSAETTGCVMCWLTFLSLVLHTMLIVDALALSKLLGRTGSFSGLLISLFMLGVCLGMLPTWLILKCDPESWRNKPRTILMSGLSISCVGAFVYLLVVCLVTGADSGWELSSLTFMLASARTLVGVGSGVSIQFVFATYPRLFVAPDRPWRMTALVFMSTLGIACGPLLSTAVHATGCTNTAPRDLGLVQFVMILGSLLMVSVLYPNQDAVEDHMPEEAEPDIHLQGDGLRKGCFIGACLAMCTMRAFVVSALEAATSMLLEDTYQWSAAAIGVSVAASLLIAIPIRGVFLMTRDLMLPTTWIRVTVVVALLGSVLMMPRFSPGLPGSTLASVSLLVADSICFSCFYLGDSVSLGLMQQHCTAHTFLDLNNVSFVSLLLMNGVGRFLGPWLARVWVESSGQQRYAISQLFNCVVYLIIFELIANPLYKQLESNKRANPKNQ